MDPFTKFIEVCAAGAGILWEPINRRFLTNEKAHEIKTLAAAVNEAQTGQLVVELRNGELSITKNQQAIEATKETNNDLSLTDRTLTRLFYQEKQKQQNLEEVVSHAADELRNEQTVSSEPVDKDWTTRFFSIAEDISNEDMQRLWSKVLAGEVKQPGSYSLRTLELLRNLTVRDAEVLTKAAKFAFRHGPTTHMLWQQQIAGPESNFQLPFVDVLLLRELGLVTEPLQHTLRSTDTDVTIVYTFGTRCLIVERGASSSASNIPVISFTRIGHELLSLIDVNPDIEYLKHVASFLKGEHITLSSADITRWEGDFLHYDNLEIINP
ncbi:MAG: DUF2806 domain-containing protein [Chloroflexota bacterium]|nr:DUF2806 domain-containing protein [Chloroflexota bacterium]